MPVALATIPEPALMLTAAPFAVMIELAMLTLFANTSNVLVVFPRSLPFAFGITSPITLIFPFTVAEELTSKEPLTVSVCLTRT
jgi:hypothetical protein